MRTCRRLGTDASLEKTLKKALPVIGKTIDSMGGKEHSGKTEQHLRALLSKIEEVC